MSGPPDFYATEEQRAKLIKTIAKSEAKIFNKRLSCREYCDKLLDHIQLMRKDLLCLDSNEDAIAIHEELKGITDVRFTFTVLIVCSFVLVYGYLWYWFRSICNE